MQYRELLDDLDRLAADTYLLWDPGWVTFNWRGYTYDHVQRVRGLALRLCTQEGGDPLVIELAALLHDITKTYDGEYLVDEAGKRLLDAQGHWRNRMRPPVRANEITRLYDQLGLSGQLHSDSGAALARRLLCARGLDEATCNRVAQTIRDHLHPPVGAPIESLCLYDADTMDANIGLPAFVRNIYINLHFYDARKAPSDAPIQDLLYNAPLGFLRPYITEKLPTWSEGKQRDFIPRLCTQAAREIALTRLQRLMETWRSLAEELEDFTHQSQHGCLAAVLHFMRQTEDPSIAQETRYLAQKWLSSNGATPQAHAFIAQLQREAGGVA